MNDNKINHSCTLEKSFDRCNREVTLRVSKHGTYYVLHMVHRFVTAATGASRTPVLIWSGISILKAYIVYYKTLKNSSLSTR